MSAALLDGSFDAFSSTDPFGSDEESVGERRSRILAENDLNLMWQLRHIRETLQITQAQLAERMGVSQPALAAFESQGNDPKLSTIRRYAHALGVIVDHGVAMDLPTIDAPGVSWGSSQVVHLAAHRAQRAVPQGGWR